MLDMRSVLVSGIMTDVICTLVVTLLWRQNRSRFEGLSFWVTDFALQTAGLLLIVLRGLIPDWISIIPSNSFVLVGALMGLWGLERFTGLRNRYALNVVLALGFLVIHIYLTVAHPCLWARSANIALALLLVCLQCAWLLLKRVDASVRPVTRLVGLVFASYSLLFLLRIVSLLLRQDTANEYLRAGINESLFLMATQMHFILLTYALVLMVNQQLISEREKTLSEIKILRGLLPICASCKKVRDEQGTWHPVEAYVHTHSEADFSHGLCPVCEEALCSGSAGGKPEGG